MRQQRASKADAAFANLWNATRAFAATPQRPWGRLTQPERERFMRAVRDEGAMRALGRAVAAAEQRETAEVQR